MSDSSFWKRSISSTPIRSSRCEPNAGMSLPSMSRRMFSALLRWRSPRITRASTLGR